MDTAKGIAFGGAGVIGVPFLLQFGTLAFKVATESPDDRAARTEQRDQETAAEQEAETVA